MNLFYLKGQEIDLCTLLRLSYPPLACHYGDYRYFCYCPFYDKRVQSLFLYKTSFACRHCLKLIYPSQNETLSLRLYKKAKKIKSKLNGPFTLSMLIISRYNSPSYPHLQRCVQAFYHICQYQA